MYIKLDPPPGESSQDTALDEVLDLSIGLLLHEAVDQGSGGLAVAEVRGLGLGVKVLRGRLQERVEELEAVLNVQLVGGVQREVFVAGQGREGLLVT